MFFLWAKYVENYDLDNVFGRAHTGKQVTLTSWEVTVSVGHGLNLAGLLRQSMHCGSTEWLGAIINSSITNQARRIQYTSK